jgi:CO/xanthine dehydrogenase FAD-binding subunit
MRANPAEFELIAPATLAEAIGAISADPGAWLPISGGTDLMVLYAAGKLPPRKMLSIFGLPELRSIDVSPAEIRIGAGSTYTDIRRHNLIAREFPLLGRSASWTGGIANQNRGTLGGNIANASPAGDSLPVLLACDADLILISSRGERRIPYRTFHTGYKKTLLAPDELILAACLPRKLASYRSYSRKVGARNAQAISKVFLAALAKLSAGKIEDIHLAAGSVGPIPLRLTQTEKSLNGRAIDSATPKIIDQALAAEIRPIDDMRSSARYRTVVLRNLIMEFLGSLRSEEAPK